MKLDVWLMVGNEETTSQRLQLTSEPQTLTFKYHERNGRRAMTIRVVIEPAQSSQRDYRALLAKYIAHVGICEGTAFLSELSRQDSAEFGGGFSFTDDEWDALQEVDEESES